MPTVMVPAGATILAAGAQASTDRPYLGTVIILVGAGLMVSAAWPAAHRWLPRLRAAIDARFPSRAARLNLVSTLALALITVSLIYVLLTERRGDTPAGTAPAESAAAATVPPTDAPDTMVNAREASAASCETTADDPDSDRDEPTIRASTDDIAMFRNGPEHRGATSGGDVPMALRQRWSFPTWGEVSSSPAIVDGTVYFGSVDDRVYAVDARSGELRWQSFTLGSVRSSPAVVGETVYVGSTDGYLYALEPPMDRSGRATVKWMYAAPGAISSSPTVVDDLVYIGAGAIDDYEDGGYIVAVDIDTGEQRWCVRTDDAILSSPAVVDGTLFVGSWDRRLYALNARTGEERWPPFRTDHEIYSSPTVANGLVYFGGYDGNVYALDAKTGDLAWPQPFYTAALVYTSPAVHDGAVYIASWNGYLYRLDAETGTELDEPIWLGGEEQSAPVELRSSPTIAGDALYIGSPDDHLYVVDLTTWTIATTFETGGEVRSSPAVAGGVIYVGSADNALYALEGAPAPGTVPSSD